MTASTPHDTAEQLSLLPEPAVFDAGLARLLARVGAR